ncbi:MAG: YjbQ family protein [Candidatus Doudnabacteria bacterium]|nr:YjbQ family protein [Candidatus Doudnabacteria bacterium]
MKTYQKKIQLETKKQFEMLDITSHVRTAVIESGVKEGMVTVFSPHTTASIKLNHFEPLLLQDLMKTIYRLVPLDISYSHDLFEVRQNVAPNERSNGHAHVKAFLLGSSENLIVQRSEILLGEKQSIFFIELDGGRHREAWIKILGE